MITPPIARKIVLLFPNFKLFEFFSVTPHQPSLSLGYLAGMLSQTRSQFLIIDAAAENLNEIQIMEKIREYNPTYVGITTNVALAYSAVHHAIYIKQQLSNIKIVMGGPWATAQDQVIIKKKYADIVVLGEGEYSIIDLLSINPNDLESLRQIKGISFATPDGVYSTGRRDLIKNLDELPFPKWEVFPKKGYQKSARRYPLYPLLTSRGCPYDCKNCTKIIHGYQLRYRSVENILAELDYLKKLGAKEIVVEDDMFNLDLPRLKHLFREIIKRKYGFKFQLSNGIRADFIDLELAHLLYAAGTYRVAVSIESGSQKVLDFLNKKLDLQKVPPAIKTLKQAHLVVSGYFILGIPVETYESLLYTVKFANSLNLDIVVLLNVLVFPSTHLMRYVQEHTHECVDRSEINPVMNYLSTPLKFTTPRLNQKIIRKVKTYYFVTSFLNPRKFFAITQGYSLIELVMQIGKYFKMFTAQMVGRLRSRGKNKRNAAGFG